MEIEGPSRGKGKLSIAPLIDIVFLLLVFFLLTSALSSSDKFELDLPKSEAGRDPDADAIILQVSEEGEFALGSMTIAEEDLASALTAEAGGPEAAKQAALLVKADSASYTEYVMDVIEVAREIGLKKLTIATTPE